MPQSLAAVYLHIVFSTKSREPALSPELLPRLRQYMAGTLSPLKCKLLNANGMPDHLHLLVSFGREVTIAGLVGTVKSSSSRWLHDTFPHLRQFAWQAGYGVFAVTHPGLPATNAYIDGQQDHHRGQTFQDEFRELLTAHGEGWDERYVWD
jgi:putative transposase